MSEREPIRRDPQFRPNHGRSVTISGDIDDALVARLLPEIVRLQSVSRKPITVYINSPGGDTECAKMLLEALRASDQDRSEPCRLITVALGEASSAASDILMAGDYALAYPYSKILCHGTRHIISRPTALTRDVAASFAKDMAGQDEGYALTLARNCIDRFMFQLSLHWRLLYAPDTQGASAVGNADLPNAEKLALDLIPILKLCGFVPENILGQFALAGRSAAELLSFVDDLDLDSLNRVGESNRKERIRSALLQEALAKNESDLVFGELEARYHLLCDFFEEHHYEMIKKLSDRWRDDLFSSHRLLSGPVPSSASSMDFASDQERWRWVFGKISTICSSIWYLFVFFCRQLQTGDFPMTATEAYWLGLIDEVIGLDLPSPRILVENAPDIPNEAEGAIP